MVNEESEKYFERKNKDEKEKGEIMAFAFGEYLILIPIIWYYFGSLGAALIVGLVVTIFSVPFLFVLSWIIHAFKK